MAMRQMRGVKAGRICHYGHHAGERNAKHECSRQVEEAAVVLRIEGAMRSRVRLRTQQRERRVPPVACCARREWRLAQRGEPTKREMRSRVCRKHTRSPLRSANTDNLAYQ